MSSERQKVSPPEHGLRGAGTCPQGLGLIGTILFKAKVRLPASVTESLLLGPLYAPDLILMSVEALFHPEGLRVGKEMGIQDSPTQRFGHPNDQGMHGRSVSVYGCWEGSRKTPHSHICLATDMETSTTAPHAWGTSHALGSGWRGI